MIEKGKKTNNAGVYVIDEILKKNKNLSPAELVLLTIRRSKELREEGIRDDCGVRALEDFSRTPSHIQQTRENLIDSLRKKEPEIIDNNSKD